MFRGDVCRLAALAAERGCVCRDGVRVRTLRRAEEGQDRSSVNVLLLNQAFYPDVVSTAQHLTDLAVELAERGCAVTVMAGRSAYDNGKCRYPRSERYRGIQIKRLAYTSLGKKSRLSRAIDVATFNLGIGMRLWFLPKTDVVVSLTSPPLLALFGALFSLLRGARFIYWVMDLNPDEALAAGWLRKGSPTERLLEALSRIVLRASSDVVVLDRFMAQRVQAKGVSRERIRVLPPWAHDSDIKPVSHENNRFRKQHGLSDKFVVMYSGNHSPCHPLDTLLEAALLLKAEREIAFVFIGGGTGVAHVREFVSRHALTNVRQFPYQPRAELSYSLSAADLHVVVMGETFVGIVHPCKVYGVLCTGRPFVLIGPKNSHVGELILREGIGYQVEHGDVRGLVEVIGRVRALRERERRDTFVASRRLVDKMFSRKVLSPKLADLIVRGSRKRCSKTDLSP